MSVRECEDEAGRGRELGPEPQANTGKRGKRKGCTVRPKSSLAQSLRMMGERGRRKSESCEERERMKVSVRECTGSDDE